MSDLVMTSGATSYGASGANMLLRGLAANFVVALQDWGGPLRFFTNVSAQVGEFGDRVGVPVAPNSASYLRTDGSAIVLNDETGTTIDVTLNRPREFFFGTTSMAKSLLGGASSIALMMKINSAIAAVYNGMVQDVIANYVSGATANAATGTYNTALTEAVLVQSSQTILDQRPPEGDGLVALVRTGTNAWGALAQLANWAQAQTILSGGEGVLSPTHDLSYGQGRAWHMARWFMTQSMPKTGTSIDNLIFHPAAFALAVRLPAAPSAGLGVNVETVSMPDKGIQFQLIQQWDTARQAEVIGLKVIYGSTVVKPEWAIQVKS